MFSWAYNVFLPSYVYKRVRGFIFEIFEVSASSDVKLSGDVFEGASFTLLNLVIRRELYSSLRLPVDIKLGTIGRLHVSGLDSLASRAGKLQISLTDVTLIFGPSCDRPGDLAHLTAARRTLLELWFSAFSETKLEEFLDEVMDAGAWSRPAAGKVMLNSCFYSVRF